MLRKENRNPNRQEHINKSMHAKPPHHSNNTPDPTTSRLHYKPKFIKKFINIQQDLIADHPNHRDSISNHHSFIKHEDPSGSLAPQDTPHQFTTTYLNSPTSLT